MSRRVLAFVLLAPLAAGCGGAGHGRGKTSGTSARRHAAGLVLLVAGSGFQGVPARAAAALRLPPALWQSWGLRPRPVPYRAGAPGLHDVQAALAAAHRSAPGAPVCLYGESSGGTWALVAAARDRSVRCVIVAASPTDQETWARARTSAARVLARRKWPGYFGPHPDLDNAFEPYDVWGAVRPHVPVLGLYADGDPAVPAQQGEIFRRADPSAVIRVLPRGRRLFVHSKVSAPAAAHAVTEVRRFVLRYDSG